MEDKIVIRNLSKVFGKNPKMALEALKNGKSKDEILNEQKQTIGVHDVNFTVKKSEIFVLMGLSGSGKSTLQRLINRLHTPSTGEIVIDGIDITKLNPHELRVFRRKHFCGMVFQNFAILPHRTVLENVEFGLELQGVEKDIREQKSLEVIKSVGLDGNEDSYPSQLSGGMQQRVGLARGLAVDADILLMDEAFSALDPLIRRQMQDELLELQEKMQKTIVFVTHDLDEAFRLGNRIAIMKDGRIVQIGSAEEIISKPADDYVKAFVENMNRSAILTAGAIMLPPEETALSGDGPRTIMRKIRKKGLAGILMTDTKKRVKGYIKADRLAAYIKENQSKENIPFDENLVEEAASVNEDTPLTDVINSYTEHEYGPVAVVDSDNRLKGVIVRGAVIAALSEDHIETAE
ncbi:glycine betaine/L-proline ABC transporter ATP-binding protein [Marinilabiliaceae bacterium ANBcel2]|nr:glycine betaine/L-proline ABC transporter ATP-binding protein [Marinilabiliaceae bacterium ANBcel2]